MRWGSGSLQEIDHLPFVSPLVKSARDGQGAGPDRGDDRGGARPGARRRPSGPTFLDYPLDVVFTEAEVEVPALPAAAAARAGRRASRRRRRCWPAAERPAIMAGTGLYWGHGEGELRALAEALGIPVFLNGLGRGCLPADHELAFSRARGTGAEGRRRGARGRRADGLPARLRRQLRRGDEDRPPRRRAQRADRQPRCPRSTWSATSPRASRRSARRPAGAGRAAGAGWSSCARSRRRSGRRSRRS